MNTDDSLEIFLVTLPGLEDLLRAEAVEKGFRKPTVVPGGVTVKGDWPSAWRANLELRGASRVLVRLGAFRVQHLSELDKRARRFPWAETLRPDVPVRIDVTCKKSRIYHSGAVSERIAGALGDGLGIAVAREAEVCLKVRVINDLCTVSVDTSGDGLHKRGHKQAVNKAPMRETLASLILRFCGYAGKEPVVDPMCGSGTFVIEAAEIAARFYPGRSRRFAFEQLATFDEAAWADLKARENRKVPDHAFLGFDRDAGAVRMSTDNAARAGLSGWVTFAEQEIGDLTPPDGPPGLVIVNPPYGARIGDEKQLKGLYRTLGETLKGRFSGWRVGLVTNSDALATATGLAFARQSAPFSHGGLRIKIYVTEVLP